MARVATQPFNADYLVVAGGGASGITTGGGGGGAGDYNGTGSNSNGGSGIINIRYPSASVGAISLTPGTNVTTTAPNGDGIATFTVSGTLVIGY